MSDRGIVWSGNFCIGDVGEMSGRGIVLLGSCPMGNYPSGNCLSGICPRGNVSRGSVQSGKYPVTEKSAFRYKKAVLLYTNCDTYPSRYYSLGTLRLLDRHFQDLNKMGELRINLLLPK